MYVGTTGHGISRIVVEYSSKRRLGRRYSIARNGRINAKGRFTFHSGGGYDVIDMDLLDGNGNGERAHILDREYNVYVSREYK